MFPDMFRNIDLLQKGLGASQLRQEVIANNIANNDTPGFKASHVEFETFMKQALEEEDAASGRPADDNPKHIRMDASSVRDVQAEVVQDANTNMRMDGNNVDIDEQMTELAKNTIYYNTLSMKVTSEFSRLRMAIDGK